MSLSRKSFLKMAGYAVPAAQFARVTGAKAAVAQTFKDDIKNALPSIDQIWDWEKRLASLCPTFTGSDGHNTFVDMLDEGLKEVGYKTERQRFTFPYWKPVSYGLAIGGEAVHVPGYRPYSGPTGPEGVTAPLVYVGSGKDLDFSKAAGKIALIDIPYIGDLNYEGNFDVVGTVPASAAAEYDGARRNPTRTGMSAPNLEAAQKAGVVGAIYIWNGVSDENAQDQVQPFFAPPEPVPTIWAGHKLGQRLKAEADKGTTVNLIMHATVHPDTPSETLWTYLPGMTDDVVIVNTHTDGCNACEENGGIAVMSLARAMMKLPKEKRLKSYVFLFTTGHFAHGYFHGAPEWQKENPDLMQRTIACMTIEHLGAIDYRDDANGNYVSTGHPIWSQAYTPTRAMSAVFLKAAAASGGERMAAVHPHKRYSGEGMPFWAVGVPTLSYITGPDYLMAAPPKDGEIGRLSKKRMEVEINTFARCLEQIDAMTRLQIIA
jgi:hypothetical protein